MQIEQIQRRIGVAGRVFLVFRRRVGGDPAPETRPDPLAAWSSGRRRRRRLQQPWRPVHPRGQKVKRQGNQHFNQNQTESNQLIR